MLEGPEGQRGSVAIFTLERRASATSECAFLALWWLFLCLRSCVCTVHTRVMFLAGLQWPAELQLPFASSVTCHFLSACGPWTAISPGRWMWTVLSGRRTQPPQAPRPRVPSRHGCCEGSPGTARLLCTGLDASAECRFSLCYYMPCQADFFLPEKFKVKTRI